MNYKLNQQFSKDLGFQVTSENILTAVETVNEFLSSLPPLLYRNIDFKTTGAMIGAILCVEITNTIEGASVNPIEKGHPDIIPTTGINSTEEVLRNYPQGLEVKGTIGNLRTGVKLKAGEERIGQVSGITWQAHHQEVNNLLGIVWDFVNTKDGFNFPAITGAFFSSELTIDDWGQISGTTGRNTKVCGMKKSGKKKMGVNWIVIYDNKSHIDKYTKYLDLPQIG